MYILQAKFQMIMLNQWTLCIMCSMLHRVSAKEALIFSADKYPYW